MAYKIVDSGFTDWTADRLPDLTGKLFVITGGNSGIGFEAAKSLAKAGGDIVIACRNPDKGARAVKSLVELGAGKAEQVALDLSDLSSVRAAAADLHHRFPRIDTLVNNAGIMQTPQLKTKDGFELQLGTNHIGHFLWTALLFDMLDKDEGRVVTVTSIAHKFGRMHFNDLMLEENYTPSVAYGQSKLANIMFAFELDKRLKAAGSNIKSIACHPGYSSTSLQSTGPEGLLNTIYKFTNRLFAQSAEKGALPTVLSAGGDEAVGGAYYGPTGILDVGGPVGDASVAKHALKQEDWARVARRCIGQDRVCQSRWPMASHCAKAQR
ncbi:oxidoreductase [Sphingorhabdus sp. Alg239-R122]|uniref:oxidoreductase n=1 Tax=Sphingorhabdus sp. Alg239-R122 TaxID=2305989 RepID=UPI0013DCDCA7|nr:oxidoreductase [Sphingorhabdus sp. Alg239-R122]